MAGTGNLILARNTATFHEAERLSAAVSSHRNLVVKIVDDGSKPTTVAGRFAAVPVRVGGVEVEGGVVSFADLPASPHLVVTVLGPSVPAAGDRLVATRHGGRWYADKFVSGPPEVHGNLPGCPCTPEQLPGSLNVVVERDELNDHIFHDCTLAYGTTPAALAGLNLGTNSYLSTEAFTDDVTPDPFYYHLFCYQGYYAFTRVFQYSILGAPWRDSIRYRWVIGFPGNTCSPFHLDGAHGQIYTGGDPRNTVTIS